MIIPFILSLWLITRKKWLAVVPFVLTGFAQFHSFSRSAWIGAVVAMFFVLFIRLKGWWKLSLLAPLVAMTIAAVILSGPVRAMSTNLTFYVFHGQFVDGRTNGSDSNRLQNAQYGLEKFQDQPLGYGLGTAGPASKNTAQPVITENSYLQIGIETGVIGLLLFGLTLLLTMIALSGRFGSVDESAALLAILLGLCATNLFLHTWADSATALVLWGLMGYCLAAPNKRVKA
jgi:O-antigen ligase